MAAEAAISGFGFKTYPVDMHVAHCVTAVETLIV